MNEIGYWITHNKVTPFYARKQFYIQKNIMCATAQVCGLGQFNFYVNGNKVEDHILDPGWTNYNKIIQYVNFDVTKHLLQGNNVIGAEVGNGWFIKCDDHYTFEFPSFMPPNPNAYQPFGKSLVLALKLTIVYADGSKEVITADDSFRVKDHMITASNVYGSENMDGRLRQIGWNEPGFDDSLWKRAAIVTEEEEPKGVLTEQKQPPVKIIKSYDGKYIHDYNKRKIYDFTQNMAGILEVEVKGKAGEVIKFYPAEKLTAAGDVDQMAKNWMMIDSCITYTVGQDEVWELCRMEFTYFAGRYIAVEGNPRIKNMKGHAITSTYVSQGAFTCDDNRFEQIYKLIEKTVEANMLSVHTDCPTIERFPWQEINHLMAPSIMYMKDGKALWEKFFLDMRMDQLTKEDYFFDREGNKYYPGEGLIPSICPAYVPNVLPVPGMGSFYDIIPWGSACILGVYWHYMFYGDSKVIEDNYTAGLAYLKYLQKKVNEEGFINHGLGDWGHPKNNLSRENIETAFLFADSITLAKFAHILGKEADKAELEEYAEKIKSNYNAKLLKKHPTEGFYYYQAWDQKDEPFFTQATQALPLYWGLVPEEKEKDVAKALRFSLEKEDSFMCGEVGLPYVIQMACKYGMNDLICKYILKAEHPSYYAFILDGETTLGEYWEQNPRSHCHDMMGHIIEWYFNGIAGIIPEEPGFKKIVIQPYLPQSMNRFECSYKSVQGLIKVCAERIEGKVNISVEVPDSIEYKVDEKNLK